MKVFREARPATTARNLTVTALQTSVFWLVFVALIPWGLYELEHSGAFAVLELTRFALPGQGVLGLTVFVAMGALNLWSGYTMAVIGRGTPFPAATARALVIQGPYRYLRNPMAVGGLGAAVGLGLCFGSSLTVAYAVAGGVVWNLIARPMEEQDLSVRFGEPYDHYRAHVRCWVPGLKGYTSPQAAP